MHVLLRDPIMWGRVIALRHLAHPTAQQRAGRGPTRLLHSFSTHTPSHTRFGRSTQCTSPPRTYRHAPTTPLAILNQLALKCNNWGCQWASGAPSINTSSHPDISDATFKMGCQSNDTQISILLHLNPDPAQLKRCLRLTGIR